jgi:hypothetical protein
MIFLFAQLKMNVLRPNSFSPTPFSPTPAFDAPERKELLKLLAGRIGQLPEVSKKVLAAYYFNGLRFADIAACFNLTELRICEIHTQAIGELRNYVRGVHTLADLGRGAPSGTNGVLGDVT